MSCGWTVNLSTPGYDQEVELPVPPLFQTSVGPVVELVFWAQAVQRWVHAVSEQFARVLPQGHVQVAYGDLTWIRGVAAQRGSEGLQACVGHLEDYQRRETAGWAD